MKVIVTGTDQHGIADAIEAESHTVTTVDIGNGESLDEAGIEATDVYLVTEMAQATSIAVAKELNPDLRIVVYADGSLPEFATRQADLVIDPELLDVEAVAEELG
ncbi:MAG: DUF7126 family protein [archaeon]